jgi:hypothetical protein
VTPLVGWCRRQSGIVGSNTAHGTVISAVVFLCNWNGDLKMC